MSQKQKFCTAQFDSDFPETSLYPSGNINDPENEV